MRTNLTPRLRSGKEVVRTELARAFRLPFGPFQFLDESNKLLQLSETLDRRELQIFANQRSINIAGYCILTSVLYELGKRLPFHKIPSREAQMVCMICASPALYGGSDGNSEI
jgi:hypothetical protein